MQGRNEYLVGQRDVVIDIYAETQAEGNEMENKLERAAWLKLRRIIVSSRVLQLPGFLMRMSCRPSRARSE